MAQSSTPLADALALVDKVQNHPDFGLGSAAELAKLRELAEAVRRHLLPPGPRYIAHVTAEQWIRDQAVEVDAPGPQEWDCTAYAAQHLEYLARMDRQTGLPGADRSRIGSDEGVLDNDDVFADDPDAPAWVAAWQGPLTIRIRREES